MGHKDLRFGQIVFILVFYDISFFLLLPLDGFKCIFLCRVYCVTVKTKNLKECIWHERSRPGRIFASAIKKSNKSRFDTTATVVRNSVLIISILPSTFQDCRVYMFSDNLSRNSCIQCGTLVLVSRESPEFRY